MHWRNAAVLSALLFAIAACGNGGHIDFDPGYIAKTSKTTGFDMVSGGQALAIENGKSVASGYHAKLQLNPKKGTTLEGSGYSAKIKYTVRNR